MTDLIGKKVLITTGEWFYASDGKTYNAVHGTLKGIHEAGKTLGFIPNRAHANWYLEVGNLNLMGCQGLYVLQCDEINTGDVEEWKNEDGNVVKFTRPSAIFITD